MKKKCAGKVDGKSESIGEIQKLLFISSYIADGCLMPVAACPLRPSVLPCWTPSVCSYVDDRCVAGLVVSEFAEQLKTRVRRKPRRQAFDMSLDDFIYTAWVRLASLFPRPSTPVGLHLCMVVKFVQLFFGGSG